MTLEEKAKEYALKALESEIDKVQKAYIEGYNAAKADKHEPIDIDGVKYYDMDLPSGTLWSEPIRKKDGSLLRLPYNEAKQYELPTEKDWDELLKYTKTENMNNCFICYSVEGNKIDLLRIVTYWIKSEVVYNRAYAICEDHIYNNRFIGDAAAIILVKHKQQ